MLPSNLITPILTLGGVCLVFTASFFYYFKDKVDTECNNRVQNFFSHNINEEVLELIKMGEVAEDLIKEIGAGILNLFSHKRRLKNTVTYMPLAGILFIFSSIFSSLGSWENVVVSQNIRLVGWLSDIFFLLAVISLIYGIYNFTIIARNMS